MLESKPTQPTAGNKLPAHGSEIPQHVAIIMDGNGRWAAKRSLPRSAGHQQGVRNVREIVRCAGERGIRYLTLFSFSSENWQRPVDEVDYLMGLLKRFIRQDLADLHKAGVRVKVIGRRDDLDAEILALIEEAERLTAGNEKMTVVVAFNYGSRDEIARAFRAMQAAVQAGDLATDDVSADTIDRFLDTAAIPDPDLVIRTSGEQRLSNFLLWQSAYAEFVFAEEYWPDFDAACLDAALESYGKRERRFGRVTA